MSFDNTQNSAVANALKERKRLEGQIKDALREIERIDAFLRLYRDFLTLEPVDKTGAERAPVGTGAQIPSVAEQPKLDTHIQRQASGQAQAIFENLAISVLRDAGRPMKSGEIVDEFRNRGHPIKGNEVRTAWNRLWLARKNGLLSNIPNLGYWIAGETLTEEARQRAAAAPRHRSSLPADRNKGKRKGPAPALTLEQLRAGEKLLLDGKSRHEVAAVLGGVSQWTIRKYFGTDEEFKAKHPDVVIPKRPYVARPRRPGTKPLGRPPKLTLEQARQVVEMRGEGKTIEQIATTMGVSRGAVYGSLKKVAEAGARGG